MNPIIELGEAIIQYADYTDKQIGQCDCPLPSPYQDYYILSNDSIVYRCKNCYYVLDHRVPIELIDHHKNTRT